MKYFDAEPLQSYARSLLKAGGFTDEEARLTAQSLVLSNLKGHDSHGIMRVAEYLKFLKDGEVVSGAELDIIRDSANGIMADAQRGLGQIQMPRLIERLLDKIQDQAVVCGSIKNCGHTGRIGEWTEMVAAAGYSCMLTVNDNGVLETTAPPGGKEGRTSTNPIAFAMPKPDGAVFALDFATSAVAIGKMSLAYLDGKDCAEGLIQDSEGHPATDPSVLFKEPKGALLPMGGAQGYKGFGLSMMIDCLTAGLSGGFAPPAPDEEPEVNNVTLTIWNPEFFAGGDHIKSETAKYCDHVRNTPPTNPAQPVRVAGDKSSAEMQKREAEGIPVDNGTLKLLARYAEKVGIDVPEDCAPETA